MTDKQRADAVERIEAERRERLACSDSGCDGIVEYVATIAAGNDEGEGSEYLMQCPKCKTVRTSDRYA